MNSYEAFNSKKMERTLVEHAQLSKFVLNLITVEQVKRNYVAVYENSLRFFKTLLPTQLCNNNQNRMLMYILNE